MEQHGRADPDNGAVCIVFHALAFVYVCMVFEVFWMLLETLLPEPVHDTVSWQLQICWPLSIETFQSSGASILFALLEQLGKGLGHHC